MAVATVSLAGLLNEARAIQLATDTPYNNDDDAFTFAQLESGSYEEKKKKKPSETPSTLKKLQKENVQTAKKEKA